jgi:hypothetical protein
MPSELRPAAPAPTTFLSPRAVIRGTAWVVPRRGDPGTPYYLIVTGPDHEPGASEQLYLTRDPALYAMAAALEGSERRVQLQWRAGQAVGTQRARRLLEAIR